MMQNQEKTKELEKSFQPLNVSKSGRECLIRKGKLRINGTSILMPENPQKINSVLEDIIDSLPKPNSVLETPLSRVRRLANALANKKDPEQMTPALERNLEDLMMQPYNPDKRRGSFHPEAFLPLVAFYAAQQGLIPELTEVTTLDSANAPQTRSVLLLHVPYKDPQTQRNMYSTMIFDPEKTFSQKEEPGYEPDDHLNKVDLDRSRITATDLKGAKTIYTITTGSRQLCALPENWPGAEGNNPFQKALSAKSTYKMEINVDAMQ